MPWHLAGTLFMNHRGAEKDRYEYPIEEKTPDRTTHKRFLYKNDWRKRKNSIGYRIT